MFMTKPKLFRLLLLVLPVCFITFVLIHAFTGASPSLHEKTLFVYLAGIFLVIMTIFSFFYKKTIVGMRDISGKLGDLEKLLLDIRDGTKMFYREKRHFMRVQHNISAKIDKEDCPDFIQIIDISYGGALLKTKHILTKGEVFGLILYLPLYPQPISVKAQVRRVFSADIHAEGEEIETRFGVEFIQVDKFDKEKLEETVNVLYRHLNE